MSKAVTGVMLALVLAGAATLYLTRLSRVPPYLMHDEVNFSLQAHAIATTGRDTNGRLLPVYFSEVGFEAGRDPLMIYWTAAFLAIQPLTDASVRMPTAALAVLTAGLMFLAARRLLGDTAALIAAAFLALTPGYFTNARLALSITYGIPFVVSWLWCCDRRSTHIAWPLAAGACLGLGLYSYLANMILMPVLLLAAVFLLWKERRDREAMLMGAGFAVLLVPLALWLVFYPDRFSNIAAAYTPHAGGGVTLRDRMTAFWMFFNPDYLFISGDGRMTNSTRAAGLFPLSFAILIPIGLFRLARKETRLIGLLVVIGFLMAPVATAVSGRLEINRVLIAIPFGVIAAACGAAYMFSRSGAGRAAAIVLTLGVLVQFAGFYRHYHGPYPVAAGAWFGGDNRTAINLVLDRVASSDVPRVYLDGRTPIERYWRFYAAARGRGDLAEVPQYYDPTETVFSDAPRGAIAVCEAVTNACAGMESAGWTLVNAVTRIDGEVTHRIYQRGQ